MVTFTVNNIFTHVDQPEVIRTAIDKFFVIKKDSFVKGLDWKEYNETGKTKIKTIYKPQVTNLYNYQCQWFPTGRLGYVADWCYENGIPTNIIDNRVKPNRHIDITFTGPVADGSNGLPPRPYQTRAVEVLRDHGGRGIFWHATASGKTATAARIIAELGVNTLYVVPSLELLNQTTDTLNKFLQIPNDHVGKIGEGVWDYKAITVATLQTLWARFYKPEFQELLKNTECIIFDEVHHTQLKDMGKATKDAKGAVRSTNSWYNIAINCPAYYRIGMTGTPGKDIEQKRALLENAIGRVIDRVSARELIDAGIISDVEIHMHNIVHSKSYPDFQSARKEGILLNDKFNEYICSVALAEYKMGKSVLILTDSKAHQGPILSSMFSRYGVEVPFISGDDTKKSRRDAREDFRDGKLRMLLGTIYKEGLDFPSLDCGILADGSKDEKKPIQFLGRVLRKAKGKGIAHLHDFLHKKEKFLQRHSQLRLSYYAEEDLDKIITHKGIEV